NFLVVPYQRLRKSSLFSVGATRPAGRKYSTILTGRPFGAQGLIEQFQQFMQVTYFIGDGQILWTRFGFGIVPTGMDAIVHAAANIRREAVSDDQDFTPGWMTCACKGLIEESSLRL